MKLNMLAKSLTMGLRRPRYRARPGLSRVTARSEAGTVTLKPWLTCLQGNNFGPPARGSKYG